MNRTVEQWLSVLTDAVSLTLSFVLFYWFRVESGLVAFSIRPEWLLALAAMVSFWVLWFFLSGLYRGWYHASRLEELLSVVRSVTFGILLLFAIILYDDLSTGESVASRPLIFGYWAVVIVAVAGGRLFLRWIQRALLRRGVGVVPVLIVGWSKRAFELADMVRRSPALGYRAVGFVTLTPRKREKAATRGGLPLLGSLQDLPGLVRHHGVREVFVGLDSSDHERLLDVLQVCEGVNVGVKILPSMYDIVSGQARITSIYGLALMDVRPGLLTPWEAVLKRGLDVVVAAMILVVGLPVWLIIALAIKLDSSGTILYRQERVGRNGTVFWMLKFRSMVADSEKKTGPVWAGKNDPRVTRLGRFLRKSHLDEIPQFWNVLMGDMSLVGPRPERPFFVDKLASEIPLYRRRLRVRPGITGWAQVKHKYDESIDDVKSKVKYDLFYIENASWRFDLKILFRTVYVMLMRKGHS